MPIAKPIAASVQSKPPEVETSSVRTSAWLVAGSVPPDGRAPLQYRWQVATGSLLWVGGAAML